MSVKVQLKKLREQKGVTQREMARLLDVTETSYRRLEYQTIESMNYRNLDILCKFFSCTPNDILEYTNDQSSV